MSVLSWLLGPSPAVTRAAQAYFEERHPEWRFGGCSVRAVEPDRTVVAVFYSVPKRPQRPGPYLLYAVHPGAVVDELKCDAESPYRIRGRK